MVLTFVDGSLLVTGAEQNLFDITADKHFATWIFFHNLVAGDQIEIKIFVKDENAGVMRVYKTVVKQNVPTDPAYFEPFLPTKQYKVTAKRLSATDRTITWQRMET